MSTDTLLRLAIFFALGVPLVLILWKVFVVGGELRRDAQHGRAAVDLARRADMSLAELSAVVDALRRRKTGPEASEAALRASAEALQWYANEAEVVDKETVGPGAAGLSAEIERARRAVALIEYGRERMLDSTSDRLAEGETSVKRGYLNLLHARDSIRARADEIAAASADWATRKRSESGSGR